MIVFILVLLLLGFLAAYFGFPVISLVFTEVTGSEVRVMGSSLEQLTQDPRVQVFLGGGIILIQFAIILFSMLDRIANTIREIIKPVARLIPLAAFGVAAYQTFEPLISGLLNPNFVAEGADTAALASAVESGAITRAVLITLGTMILFLLSNRLMSAESEEVKRLRAELARTRRALR